MRGCRGSDEGRFSPPQRYDTRLWRVGIEGAGIPGRQSVPGQSALVIVNLYFHRYRDGMLDGIRALYGAAPNSAGIHTSCNDAGE